MAEAVSFGILFKSSDRQVNRPEPVSTPLKLRVTTSSGNHGKPGKSLKKVPCMEKSWNLKKTE